jgi:intracellular sulfur oxidation DsrE/DsrF family protein
MKNAFFLLLLVFATHTAVAQETQPDVDLAEHKIVFQLTSADTNVHKMLVRQLGNVLAAAPNSKVEVVCHGPGLDILRSKMTIVYPKIQELKGKGIGFVGCENTLRERKIAREEIIPEATFVKAGIIEIVSKQEQGWSYIRAGQ